MLDNLGVKDKTALLGTNVYQFIDFGFIFRNSFKQLPYALVSEDMVFSTL